MYYSKRVKEQQHLAYSEQSRQQVAEKRALLKQ